MPQPLSRRQLVDLHSEPLFFAAQSRASLSVVLLADPVLDTTLCNERARHHPRLLQQLFIT